MKLLSLGSDPNLRRQIITFAAILGSIGVNTLSNIFPPNGVSIGKLSNTLFSPVQIIPANYAFAIWGLIYLGLIAFGIYQLQSTQRRNPSLQRGGYLLALASLAQSIWVYLFLGRFFVGSVLAMLGILGSLIGLYLQLDIGHQQTSWRDRWFIQIPISTYLGWITVATVVNIAIALYSINWNGWLITPTLWAVIMILVSATLAIIVHYQGHDFAYPLVIVWALVAIAFRHLNTPLIAVTAFILAIGLLLLLFLSWLKSDNPSSQRMIQPRQ